ncbi:MAG: CDP-diacylglycerol--glycerol-3-phosphate 3-phosphatidyltransferase [Alphaproteobacteria bacterium]|nr:CDP-diacylglycerol--glycerol-3-phosphate 3-phosphatidyltransferase [Alphaproteobacteria bacterium]
MYNLPNILTISRILVIPVIVLLFFFPSPVTTVLCGILFIAAAVTDYFDGYLARAMNQLSSFGRFLDPIADKLLVSSVLFMLAATMDIPFLGIIPALIILCREIIVSGLREYLAELQVGMPVTRLAKWKTGFQMTAIPIIIFGKELWFFADFGSALLWVAAILTLITGYDYLRAGMKYMDGVPAPKKPANKK